MIPKRDLRYGPLPRCELIMYVTFWMTCICYTLYKVQSEGNRFVESAIYLFEDGWSFLRRQKDIPDTEWEAWILLFKKCIPWHVLQIVMAECTRIFYVKGIPACHAIVTISFTVCYFPLSFTAFYLFLLLMYFAIMHLHNIYFIWLTTTALLLVMNEVTEYVLELHTYESSILIVGHASIAWFIMRCLEFTCSEYNNSSSPCQTFVDMVAYTLYFPCFHLGPLIPYPDFRKTLYLQFECWKVSRIKSFIWNLGKYVGWFFIFEIVTHYFYCNAMHLYIDVFSDDLWTFNGIGYCMGQYFFLKYFVVYGMMGTFAKAERYEAPPPPRCISWVYLYSDMWRYFDRGYYLFIFRRIYKPVCGKKPVNTLRKLWASFLCFLFAFIWHGITFTIFYWSLFNFIGIVLEDIGKTVARFEVIKQWEEKFGQTNTRRLHCLFSAPVWVLAVISNFIFFCGHVVGFMYFAQFFSGSWKLWATMIAMSYCMCQVSIEMDSLMIRKWESMAYKMK